MEIKLKSTSVLIYLLLLGGNYSASIKKVMVGLHIPLRADAFRGRGQASSSLCSCGVSAVSLVPLESPPFIPCAFLFNKIQVNCRAEKRRWKESTPNILLPINKREMYPPLLYKPLEERQLISVRVIEP